MKKLTFTLAVLGTMLFSFPQNSVAAPSVEIIEQEHQVNVTVVESTLRVTGAAGQTLTVYNVTGLQIMAIKVDGYDKHYELNLPKGCYIVKVGKLVRKIYIK